MAFELAVYQEEIDEESKKARDSTYYEKTPKALQLKLIRVIGASLAAGSCIQPLVVYLLKVASL